MHTDQILNYLPWACVEVNSAGQIIYANLRSEELFGILYADLTTKVISAVFKEIGLTENLINPLKKKLELAYASGEAQELDVHTGDYANDVCYHCHIIPVFTAHGDVQSVLIFIQNLTKNKKVEEALINISTILQQAEKVSQSGSWEYRLHTGTYLWSDGMYRLFNISKETPIEPDIYLKYVVPKYIEIARRIVSFIKNGTQDFEEVIELFVDGCTKMAKIKSTVIRDAMGQAISVLGVDVDITTLRQAEQQSLQNAAMVNGIADAMPDVLYAIDIYSLKTIYVNRKFSELCNISIEDIKAMGPAIFSAVVYDEDREPLIAAIRSMSNAQDGEIREQSFRLIDGSGEHRWLKTKIVVYWRDEDGCPTHVIGISEDVTEQLELQERNRQLRQERRDLESRQQQELYRNTLSTQEEERKRIAESLHNGLGQMLYGTKLSLGEIDLTNSERFSENLKAFEKTERLLDDCIDESRRISHQLTPVILERYGLREAILDICRQFSSYFVLECRFIGLYRRLDKQLEMAVYRLVQELVLNIVKHSGATESGLKIRLNKKDILIIAYDNGKGFDAGADSGQGIGLKTIKSKVKLLSGKLKIISEPNKGSTIQIKLPNRL